MKRKHNVLKPVHFERKVLQVLDSHKPRSVELWQALTLLCFESYKLGQQNPNQRTDNSTTG